MFNVSILEARTIIRTIYKNYGTDLSGMAMASFRLRLSEILRCHKLENAEALHVRLLDDQEFYEIFIREVSIGSADLFRDADLWIDVRDRILPSLLKSKMYPEIVIPESVTGGDLFTMAILLLELGLDYRVDIVTTCRNAKIQEQIQKGDIPNTRFKSSSDNYELFHPGSSFEKYTETQDGIRYLKPELIKEVEFRIQSPDQAVCSEKTALVLYRNKMIYQNAERQYGMMKKLLGEMKAETYFIIGIQEAIDGFGLENLYSTVSSDLNIYTKKDAY